MTSIRLAVLIGLVLSHLACDDETLSDLPQVLASIENQSQFSIEALYIHSEPLDYTNEPNRLQSPLLPGTSLSDYLPSKGWYVTVFRRPNQDSSVLAYTTAKAWNPAEFPKLIYSDEQYRASQ